MEEKIKQIIEALKTVYDPELGKDIVSLNMISDIKICDSVVSFKLILTTPACPLKDKLKKEAEEAVKKLPWVERVIVNLDAKIKEKQIETERKISGVKHIVAIVSGKGGVGKSTVAINLALALKKMGCKTGLLDGDVYGPTLSIMGKTKTPPLVNKEEKIIPPLYYGIPIISLGFLTSQNQAIIWRGPIVHGAYRQLLFDLEWGKLDYLVIDLPPGTGDPLISITQLVELSGAVLVTTPQEVSVSDVRRAGMFLRRMNVPILAIVENMSDFLCPHCKKNSHLFSGNGGEVLSNEFGLKDYIKIPFDPLITECSEKGEPYFEIAPDSLAKNAFLKLAQEVASKISVLTFKNQAHDF
ncbi:MAG: Mrp/NBP35 family ATP-binding protein [Candidatus Hydrothermales bacterium]